MPKQLVAGSLEFEGHSEPEPETNAFHRRSDTENISCSFDHSRTACWLNNCSVPVEPETSLHQSSRSFLSCWKLHLLTPHLVTVFHRDVSSETSALVSCARLVELHYATFRVTPAVPHDFARTTSEVLSNFACPAPWQTGYHVFQTCSALCALESSSFTEFICDR